MLRTWGYLSLDMAMMRWHELAQEARRERDQGERPKLPRPGADEPAVRAGRIRAARVRRSVLF